MLTHSKEAHNGSSWQDYGGCESTQCERCLLEMLIQVAAFQPCAASNRCQSGRAPSPARSGMWHLLGDAGCPLWPFVASGPSCLFCFSHNKNIQFSVFISSHFGSITAEGASHCGQREGNLVE